MSPDPLQAQVERTRLAWRRTSLAATGVALLTIGVLVRQRSIPTLAAATLMLIAWAGLLMLAQRRITGLDRSALSLSARHPTAVAPPSLPPASRAPLLLGLLTVAIALLSLSLVTLR